ncbi:MAG TPA: cytochrome c oxidase assembly factor Coa1 family protein [Acidobacteriaceae bacterium]|jgi:hypothetical protein|nr:cytochrome c oxidase assembly factor Coa1 family protein [Acidobacteriaceae bacterium]
MARTARNGLAFVVAFAALASAAWTFAYYERLLSEPRQMAVTIARVSPSLFLTLGQPLDFSRLPRAKLHSANGKRNAYMEFSVSGPLASGTLVEWAQQNGSQWRLCSLVFRPDYGSRSLDIVDNEGSRCTPQ